MGPPPVPKRVAAHEQLASEIKAIVYPRPPKYHSPHTGDVKPELLQARNELLAQLEAKHARLEKQRLELCGRTIEATDAASDCKVETMFYKAELRVLKQYSAEK